MANENYSLDDLDSIISSLDTTSVHDVPDPKELGTRKVINKVTAGALQEVMGRENLAKYGAAIAKSSLPDGYKAALGGADESATVLVDLYNTSRDALEKPFKEFRKKLGKNADKLPSFVSPEMRDRIAAWGVEEEKAPTKEKLNPDQLRIHSAMTSVFGINQAQLRQGELSRRFEAETEKRQDIYRTADLQMAQRSLDQLGRLVGYNDTVNYRWQQKSLELQHLQYFAQRDLLKVFSAYAEDNDVHMKAVVHNTALPEFQKIKMSEAFASVQYQSMYANINQTLEGYSDKYLGNIKQNIKEKADSAIAKMATSMGSVNELMSSTDGMFDGMSTGEKLEAAGGVMAGLGMDKLAPTVGGKLKKFLSKNPAVRKKSNELMYLFENFPSVFNETLKDWDGRFLPKSLLDRLPALELLNASFLKKEIQDILPQDFDGNIKMSAGTALSEPTSWDELQKRTLVEVIPGLLRQQLQELTQLRTGEAAEQRGYDFESGSFVSASALTSKLKDETFGNVARGRTKLTDALMKVLGAGSSEQLSDSAKAILREAMLEDALANKSFSIERFMTRDYGDDSSTGEIQNWIANSRGDVSQRNLSGARVFRQVGDGQGRIAEGINSLAETGQSDLLAQMGLVTKDAYGNWGINSKYLSDASFGGDVDKYATGTNAANSLSSNVGQNGSVNLSGLEALLFRAQDGTAVPVSLTGAGGQDELNNIAREGFETQISLMDAMLGALLRTETMAEEAGKANASRAKWYDGALGWLSPKATLGALGGFTKDWYSGAATITNAMAGGTAKVLGSLRGGAKTKGPAMPRDVYVEGDSQPVMFAHNLMRGKYFNQKTGKPIYSVEEIDSPVIDEDGNVVVSEADIARGLVSPTGSGALKRIGGFLSSAVTNVAGVQMQAIRMVMDMPKKMYEAVVNRVRDIYVKGEGTPRLYAYMLKNGGYFSKETKKRIFRADEIDGEVVDAQGNTIVSFEDISTGLVDNLGTPIGGNRLVQLAKNLAGGAFGVAKSLVTTSVDMGMSSMGMAYDFAGGMRDVAMGLTGSNKTFVEANGTIERIYEYMQNRWPMEGISKVEGDTDGDGIREGSWQDILSRGDDSAKAKTGRPLEDGEEEAPKENTGLFGSVFGLVGSISSGIGSMVEMLGGLGSLLASWFAWNKATAGADVAGDMLDGELPDRKGRKNRRTKMPKGGGKAGFFRRMAQGAKGMVNPTTMRAAGAAATFGAKKALTAAAGAAATVLGSPVAAAVIAAAGVAYTGYQIFGYFARRTETEPLEKLRYLQYGINPEDDEILPMIRYLESEFMDEVSKTSAGYKYELSVSDSVFKVAEDFGIDLENAGQTQQFATWFAMRFYPVIMTHLNALLKLDDGVDLLDVDDELDKENKAAYIKAVILKSSYRQTGDPYTVTQGPRPGEVLPTNEAAIKNWADALLSEYDKSKKPADTGKAVPTNSNEADAKASNYKSSEQLKAQGSKYAARYAKRMEDRRAKAAAGGGGSVPTVTKAATSAGLDTAVVGASAKASKASGSFSLMMPCGGRISSPYGYRIHPITGNRKMHKGVDIAAPNGTPIHAGESGIIYRLYYSKSYGRVIYLQHENGMATRYAHMNSFASGLKVGDAVTKGQQLGTVGNTGKSAGNHLHWELRKTTAQWAETEDPLNYVPGTAKKDVAKEEKEIAKEAKAGDKETIDSTLEGHDTIVSTAAPKALEKEDISKTPKSQTAPDKTDTPAPAPAAKREAVKAERERKATQEQNKRMAKVMDKQTESVNVAIEQRAQMVTHQARMVELLEQLNVSIENLGQQPTGRTGSVRSTRQNKVAPVVNMRE